MSGFRFLLDPRPVLDPTHTLKNSPPRATPSKPLRRPGHVPLTTLGVSCCAVQ
jgi:hypothetical protein